MIWTFDLILLVFLVITSVIALTVKDLLASAMVLGIFSFLICLIWAEMGAVDVAFTEAAVGAGVSTVIMIATIFQTSRQSKNYHRSMMPMKLVALFAVIVTGALLLYATSDFPDWGDPLSPANSSELSEHYILESRRETEVPNLVTSVLADYRGFDTMFETVVIFVAGLAILSVLGQRKPEEAIPVDATDERWCERDMITIITCRLIVPVIQLFALYVLAHGHYSPGGGFQSGVMFGASFILIALTSGLPVALQRFNQKRAIALAGFGVLVYAGTGLLCMVMGGNFLQYDALHSLLGTTEVKARYHSMLIVEIGVACTVTSIMFMIYALLSSKGRLQGGL